MWQRLSHVGAVNISIVSFTGIVQIGDSPYLQTMHETMVLEREAEIFFSKEGSFTPYKVFTEKPEFAPITEDIKIFFFQKNPFIHVGEINSNAVSNSAILHIGNGESIYSESSLLKIRQLDHRLHPAEIDKLKPLTIQTNSDISTKKT